MYDAIIKKTVTYPEYISKNARDLIGKLLMKDPEKRPTVPATMKHPWFASLKWEDVLEKKIFPPIVPSLRECYIDPDYVDLPLDFEESQYKVRMSTERRFSYYYESTLQQSKSSHDQSFYNRFFESKGDSVNRVDLLNGGSSVNTGSQIQKIFGVSIDDSESSHDSGVTPINTLGK